MKLIKITYTLLVINASLLSAYGAQSSIVYYPEVKPSIRQLKYLIDEEEYYKFQEAKNIYYANFGEAILPIKSDEIPLFEVIHPEKNGGGFLCLGTRHDLPYEIMPSWIRTLIERDIDEIYLESEFVTFIRSMPKSALSAHSLTKICLERVSSILNPLLRLFSKSVSDLSLQNIFDIIMGFDAYFGMDSTISMLSLKLNKPLFLLDQQMNITATNLYLLKEQMKSEGKEIPEGEDETIMCSYVERECDYLEEIYLNSTNIQINEKNLKSSIENWLEDRTNYLKKEYLANLRRDIEYKNAGVETRNMRWLNLILSNTRVTSRKLVCVGAGHLPDLFARFKEQGFEVKPYSKQ